MKRLTWPRAHCPQREQQPGFSLPYFPSQPCQAVTESPRVKLVHEEVVDQRVFRLVQVGIPARNRKHHQVDEDVVRLGTSLVLVRPRHSFGDTAGHNPVGPNPVEIGIDPLQVLRILGHLVEVDDAAAHGEGMVGVMGQPDTGANALGQVQGFGVSAENIKPDKPVGAMAEEFVDGAVRAPVLIILIGSPKKIRQPAGGGQGLRVAGILVGVHESAQGKGVAGDDLDVLDVGLRSAEVALFLLKRDDRFQDVGSKGTGWSPAEGFGDMEVAQKPADQVSRPGPIPPNGVKHRQGVAPEGLEGVPFRPGQQVARGGLIARAELPAQGDIAKLRERPDDTSFLAEGPGSGDTGRNRASRG